MATNVILPALGMAQDSGTIVQWRKAEGDQVQQGEPIAEIQTDKVTVELEAPATGTLAHISAQIGDEVPVGHIIALILAAGEADTSGASDHIPSTPDTSTIPGEARDQRAAQGAQNRGSSANLGAAVAASGVHLASPKAKRLATERGVDLALIKGSGSGGVILAADIVASPITTPSAPEANTLHGNLSRTWHLMAERTTESWTTIPHFYLMREVQAQALVAWRAEAQSLVSEKLTYTDLLIKIIAVALRRHPQLNASWVNGRVVANEEVNVGVVVAVSDGLLVPVISHADGLSLSAIARHRLDLVERAHSGKLHPEDLQGGTFTISNLGMYGIDAFNAIINSPQVAILAVGALVERIVPVNGLPAIVPTLVLSLSCDHRVVDGARGAQFLATIAELITNPIKF
jgi:pyruvate dehydrogenase E2 component (dihydrolipoamide acetyltransferase)